MITKDMKDFLMRIPSWPKNISFDNLAKSKANKDYLYLRLFMAAKEQEFIGINGEDEDSGIYLSEKGLEAIDEYRRTNSASSKSTWALIIAGLSFLASVIAIIVSICGVQ